MGSNKLLNFPFGYSSLFAQHHGNRDILAKSFVGHRESDGLSNCPMMQDDIFDFAWSDLFTAPVDHLFEAPGDKKISIPVDVPLVTGSEPITLKTLIVRLRAVQVARRNIGSANYKLANSTGG